MLHRKTKEEEKEDDRDIQLFEKSLRNHMSVLNFEQDKRIYTIHHASGVDVKLFLAMEEILSDIIDYQSHVRDEEKEIRSHSPYTLGQADIIEIMDYLKINGDVDFIVALSAYSAYTVEAQEVAESAGVTLLTVKEFFQGLEDRDW